MEAQAERRGQCERLRIGRRRADLTLALQRIVPALLCLHLRQHDREYSPRSSMMVPDRPPAPVGSGMLRARHRAFQYPPATQVHRPRSEPLQSLRHLQLQHRAASARQGLVGLGGEGGLLLGRHLLPLPRVELLVSSSLHRLPLPADGDARGSRLPEPKGRTYGELDVLFENRVPAREFRRTKVDQFREPSQDIVETSTISEEVKKCDEMDCVEVVEKDIISDSGHIELRG